MYRLHCMPSAPQPEGVLPTRRQSLASLKPKALTISKHTSCTLSNAHAFVTPVPRSALDLKITQTAKGSPVPSTGSSIKVPGIFCRCLAMRALTVLFL